MQWWPTGGLWRHGDFLRLWAAQIVSAVGSRITRTALPIIAILTIDATPNEIAVLGALSIAPGIVIGLLAGGWIDRSAKRPLLIAADLARAALIMTVPVAAWSGVLTMAQLYAVAGLVGVGSALFQITDNAYLPALIGKDDLVEGNAKLEATESVAEITGPGLAGVLIEALTGPVAMVFDAVTYLWSASFLARIRTPEIPAEAGDGPLSLRADIAVGFRAGFGHPLLRPIFVAAAVSTLSFGFFLTLYMLFTLDDLGLGPATVGVLISMGGVGALIGTVITTRLTPRLGLGRAMIVFLAVGQAGMLLIPMAAGPDWLVLALLVGHQIIGDGFTVAYAVQAVSLRQTVLPLSLLARVNATLQVLTGAAFLVGMLLAGPLATAIGVRNGVWAGALVGLAAPVILLFSPVRNLRRMPRGTAGDESAESTAGPATDAKIDPVG